jgi:hypothetical protein
VLVGRDRVRRRCTARGRRCLPAWSPKHLVVGAVLLDDVDHVLDQARLADALGNRARGLAGPRRQLARARSPAAQVPRRPARQRRGSSRRRQRHERQRAVVLVRVELRHAAALPRPAEAEPLDVGDATRWRAASNASAAGDTSRPASDRAAASRSRSSGSKSNTASAFIVPLATKSRAPSAEKHSAFGEACSRSFGRACAHKLVDDAPSRASSTLIVSLPALRRRRARRRAPPRDRSRAGRCASRHERAEARSRRSPSPRWRCGAPDRRARSCRVPPGP